MSKHTPGSWCVRNIPTGQRFIGPSSDGSAPSVAMVMSRVNVPDERLAADARLIAAAPDLLAALRTFANLGEYRELRDAFAACVRPHERDGLLNAFADARAAILKATRVAA